MTSHTTRLALLMFGLGVSGAVAAEDPVQFDVSLKDHRFQPAEIHVPAGKAVILKVTNLDTTAEEFDSSALKVEKIITAGKYATIRLRPLAQGKYPFAGEFHPQTASGVVIAE
jgi:plastocyanin